MTEPTRLPEHISSRMYIKHAAFVEEMLSTLWKEREDYRVDRDKWKAIAKEAGLCGDPQDPSQSIANVNEAYHLMKVQRDKAEAAAGHAQEYWGRALVREKHYRKALETIQKMAKEALGSKTLFSALLSIESISRAALKFGVERDK